MKKKKQKRKKTRTRNIKERLLDFFFVFFFFCFHNQNPREKTRSTNLYMFKERERYIEGTCSNDHMKINIEQKEMCGNNKDEKKKEENETKHSFCLEQCIVENKPKTDTHTHT
jgi:hypothetical protein